MQSPDDTGLIYEKPGHVGPGTHVIAIGISEYPHLIDGSDERVEIAEGRKQLDSAARSAKAVAQWFHDHFDNQAKPLASLALVISDGAQNGRANPQEIDASRAAGGDAASVIGAIGGWVKRASTKTENLTIFYFAGHGSTASGDDVLLWLRDFGAVPHDRFDGSLNLRKLLQGMRTQMPGEQLYLIDCCRSETKVPAASGSGRTGVSPISPARRGGSFALQNVQHATSNLSLAFGRPGYISIFADALIKALSGGGAQAELKNWVGTTGLHSALLAYTARATGKDKVKQIPERQNSHLFPLHKPSNFLVPVHIGCTPPEAWSSLLRLEARAAGNLTACHEDFSASHEAVTWSFEAPHREHELLAKFKADAHFEDASDILQVGLPETVYDLEFVRREGQ